MGMLVAEIAAKKVEVTAKMVAGLILSGFILRQIFELYESYQIGF